MADSIDLNRYLAETRRHKLLTPEEEISLARIIRSKGPGAKAARQRFINANLRLVVSVATRYRSLGIPMEDMIQEGNLGLMRALDGFSPDYGTRFATYAVWWIRQCITRYGQCKETIIRIPNCRQQDRDMVLKCQGHLLRKLGREATFEEVCKFTGLQPAKIRSVLEDPHADLIMDNLLHEDGDNHIGDMFSDEEALLADSKLDLVEIQGICPEILAVLSPRSRRIFKMRYGEDEMSLQEIGDVVGLTRERVRQLLIKEMPVLRKEARRLGLDLHAKEKKHRGSSQTQSGSFTGSCTYSEVPGR